MITVQKYKAAIVDDSQEYRATVQSVLQSVAGKAGKQIDCTQFSRAETLVYELDDGDAYFDIYVLDIQMPGINGMELGRGIRERFPDVCIIFVTSYSRFALESYEIDAYQYILKDKVAERLPRALEKFFRRTAEETEADYYTITTVNKMEKFRFKDIIRISKNGKYAEFVTKERTYKQRLSLNDVYKMLPEGDFVFIERGIIVNILHISGMDVREITLSNQEVVTASRAYLKNVKEEVTRYWSRQIG